MIENKKFTFKPLNLKTHDRHHVDQIRYYDIVEENEEPLKMVSITSITSNYKKEFFANWRKRIGVEKANRICKLATDRGTDAHTLIEHYLKSEPIDVKTMLPISRHLFGIAKKTLNRIDNIYCLESTLYSRRLKVAGTVDTIAEFDGVLSVIDYKTSEKEKPREWIESYFVQAMFYAMAFYELTGIKPKQLVIIMACEDGDCVVYIEKDLKKYMNLLVEYIRKFIEDNS
jgi:genome maintenance exonuclease 1